MAFRPSEEQLSVLDTAREDLSSVSAVERAREGDFGVDPARWCVLAGLPADTWDQWLEEFGEGFVYWFCGALVPGPLERAAMDRLFWSGWRRILASPDPNAAQMKLWAEMAGHLDKRPVPPAPPIMDKEESWRFLRSLRVEVLAQALVLAQEDERKRLALTPADVEEFGGEVGDPVAPVES